MAKRKDDFSIGFTSKKPPTPPPPADDAPPAEPSADPFAADAPAADPFASSSDTPAAEAPADAPASDTPPDAAADPFASDPFASDPFASTPETAPAADATADPFATDPFAATPETPSPEASAPAADPAADPFATDPFATDPFASAPAEAAAPAPAAPPAQAKAPAKAPRTPPKQFRMLILADFSGRTNRAALSPGDVAGRKVHAVDVDTLPRLMAKVKPELHLPVDEKTVIPLTFASLDDFRPDALLQRVDAFQGLLALRDELKNPKTFKDAAAKVRKLTGTAAPKKPRAAKPAAPDAGMSDFEQMLHRPVAPKDAGPIDTDALIANLVAGYGIPDADPEQAKLVTLVEEALSAGLRAVLRHPAFQALEAAWRGVEFLTSRLNTDEGLKLFLADVAKDDLYADLAGPPAIEKTGMYQLIVEQPNSPGNEPFSLVVGDYEFDQSPQNVALLAKLAALMHEAGVPFLAAAGPKVAGFPSFARFPDSGRWQPPADIALWDKIRGHKYAAHLGLAAPRFLLRLPYGPKTDPVDTFPFDEMPGPPVTDGYVWGNGAFAAAYAVGEAFLQDGWGFEPGTDVADLPCHMALVDGDREMTPCAQGWLSDRVGDILHQLGLIPLLSVRNAAAVKIAGLHSIAKGGKPLAAEWAAR